MLLTTPALCRRAFFDKRLAQEVEGDSLGEVRAFRSACSWCMEQGTCPEACCEAFKKAAQA